MKSSIGLVLLGLALGAGSAWSFQNKDVRRSHFEDEAIGFSIDAPRFPAGDPVASQVVAMFTGPGKDGFASNVNVTVQKTSMTAREYREQSLGQFQQIGLKLNAERSLKVSGRDALEFDYQGKIGANREMHFLALAVIDVDRVILVTCTALTEAFPAVEAEFRASLASVKLRNEAL